MVDKHYHDNIEVNNRRKSFKLTDNHQKNIKSIPITTVFNGNIV